MSSLRAMNNMSITMNVNVGSQCGGAGGKTTSLRMVVKLVQTQVRRRKEVHAKWMDLIKAGRLQAQLTLKVQEPSTKHSNKRRSVSKVTASIVLPLQDILIKNPYNFLERAVALAVFLIMSRVDVFISFDEITEFLDKHPHETAVLTMILVAILQHRLLKGTNHSGDNLQLTTGLLLAIGTLGVIPGAHSQELSDDMCSMADSNNTAANGNVLAEGANLKVAAGSILAAVVGGCALLWMLKRRAKWNIERGLRQTPIPRRNNPIFVIHPAI